MFLQKQKLQSFISMQMLEIRLVKQISPTMPDKAKEPRLQAVVAKAIVSRTSFVKDVDRQVQLDTHTQYSSEYVTAS